MSTIEQCMACGRYYAKETKKYKLSFDTPAINKVCDDCFEAIIRWILLGDEGYCIRQKMELKPMDLTDEQRKMLKSAEKITILQNGKMRNLYD